MQIEHVTNTETVIGTNYWKTFKKLYEKPKEPKTMQKRTEN